MGRGVILAVGNVCSRGGPFIQWGPRGGGSGDWVREGRRAGSRASEELGSQPAGHPCCLGAGGDGAAAHGPQAGVLTGARRRTGVRTHGEHAGVGRHSKAGPVVMGLEHG